MYRHTQQIIGAFVVAAAIALPRGANAQGLPTVGEPAAPLRAAVLEAGALKLATRVQHYHQVARMLEKAAGLRPAGDPKGVGDMIVAASAWYHSGSQTRARELYAQAAERALRDGDVDVAARTYLLAAIVANEQRHPSRDSLKARAERLAASPLLSDGQRRLILGQFGTTLQVAREH